MDRGTCGAKIQERMYEDVPDFCFAARRTSCDADLSTRLGAVSGPFYELRTR
jgi:hypothetical protein